ncbi:polyhydroxyalkanoic acid system family protein [Methylibium sp.]|uniref:polyhydroxyalkanoic acid system family protein n=1 Tax=Methylibium sp. TaxID=2067992 RepID=UPI003D11FF48
MPDISLHRSHQLGLKRARELAWKWAADAEAKFGMACTVEEGDDEDLVHFTRSGVNGTLRVSSGAFELDAKLSFLLGAFQKTIEGEIEKNLDGLLAAEHKRAKAPAAAKKVVRKKT